MLKSEHFIADVIAHLDSGHLFELELFPASVFQYGLALFVGTFILPAPFVMFVYQGEEYQLTTILAYDFQYVDELLKDMRTWSQS